MGPRGSSGLPLRVERFETPDGFIILVQISEMCLHYRVSRAYSRCEAKDVEHVGTEAILSRLHTEKEFYCTHVPKMLSTLQRILLSPFHHFDWSILPRSFSALALGFS
jgi:hypothetical protein